MDGITPETCDECGFDARRWRVRDAVSFLDALGYWWRLATDGVPSERLNARRAPARRGRRRRRRGGAATGLTESARHE